MEDLWDETIFEEPVRQLKHPTNAADNSLNIPAIMDNFSSAKAAKKALRKARKEAKKFTSPKQQTQQQKDKKQQIMHTEASDVKNNSSIKKWPHP